MKIERDRKKEKNLFRVGLGFKILVVFSFVIIRGCYGNYCERLNILRVYDCEKWVGKGIILMVKWWVFYLLGFYVFF